MTPLLFDISMVAVRPRLEALSKSLRLADPRHQRVAMTSVFSDELEGVSHTVSRSILGAVEHEWPSRPARRVHARDQHVSMTTRSPDCVDVNINGPRDQRVVTTSLSFDYLEGSCQTVLMIPSTLSQTRRLMPCLRETIVS